MTSNLALLEHDCRGQAEPCWRASQAEPRHSARPHRVSVTRSQPSPAPSPCGPAGSHQANISLSPMQTGGPRGRRGVKLSFPRKGGGEGQHGREEPGQWLRLRKKDRGKGWPGQFKSLQLCMHRVCRWAWNLLSCLGMLE